MENTETDKKGMEKVLSNRKCGHEYKSKVNNVRKYYNLEVDFTLLLIFLQFLTTYIDKGRIEAWSLRRNYDVLQLFFRQLLKDWSSGKKLQCKEPDNANFKTAFETLFWDYFCFSFEYFFFPYIYEKLAMG